MSFALVWELKNRSMKQNWKELEERRHATGCKADGREGEIGLIEHGSWWRSGDRWEGYNQIFADTPTLLGLVASVAGRGESVKGTQWSTLISDTR